MLNEDIKKSKNPVSLHILDDIKIILNILYILLLQNNISLLTLKVAKYL